MKKKLLVLLLVLALVFSFVACEKTESDEWNYFKKVYSSLKDETDIRLETIVYQQLQNMYQTSNGKFLVWFGSVTNDDSNDAAKEINDLAIKYGVKVVYNFDPVLDGGWGKDATLKTSFGKAYTADLRDPNIKDVSTSYGNLRQEFVNIFGYVPNNQLVYFAGAAVLDKAAVDELVKGLDEEVDKDIDENLDRDSAEYKTAYDAAYKTAYQKRVGTSIHPSGYATAFVNSIRISGETYFPAFGLKEKVKYDFEEVVLASCYRVPNTAKAANPFYSGVTPFDYFSDSRLHIGSGDFLADSGSVFKNITYHEFMLMLGADESIEGFKGDFLVHFGGAWCPNTQAMAFLCNNWAKRYGIDTIYLFDPYLDGNTKAVDNLYNYPNTAGASYGTNIRTNDGATPGAFRYTGLYAELLLALGGKFESQWNDPNFLSVKEDDTATTILEKYTISYSGINDYKDEISTITVDGKAYLPRMCVPNIMLINNTNKDKDGNISKIIDQVECEYNYSSGTLTSDANSEGRAKLEALLEELIKSHEFAFAYPIELEEPASAGGGGGGAAAIEEQC